MDFRIIGTEQDKVNCTFHFKVGACRHGETCSRRHIQPWAGQTLLLTHFYMPPVRKQNDKQKTNESKTKDCFSVPHGAKSSDFCHENKNDNKAKEDEKEWNTKLKQHYENFYEDVINEMIKYGDVEKMVVCQNLGDHMVCSVVDLY